MNAKGLKGFLIRTLDNGIVFRVYHEDHSFTDYDIHHYDLEVEIIGDDSAVFSDGERHWIDHSPQTLGLKIPEEEWSTDELDMTNAFQEYLDSKGYEQNPINPAKHCELELQAFRAAWKKARE